MEKYTEDHRASVIHTAIALAKILRERAYAPYSNYKVGACAVAIHPEFGTALYFGGCNVENASYGLTMCAERVAIYNAIAAGFKDIQYMVIVTEDGGTSCGACRQVEYELNPNMTIISFDAQDNIVYHNLSGLLPHAFGPHNLKPSAEGSETWVEGYKKWYTKTRYDMFESEPE